MRLLTALVLCLMTSAATAHDSEDPHHDCPFCKRAAADAEKTCCAEKDGKCCKDGECSKGKCCKDGECCKTEATGEKCCSDSKCDIAKCGCLANKCGEKCEASSCHNDSCVAGSCQGAACQLAHLFAVQPTSAKCKCDPCKCVDCKCGHESDDPLVVELRITAGDVVLSLPKVVLQRDGHGSVTLAATLNCEDDNNITPLAAGSEQERYEEEWLLFGKHKDSVARGPITVDDVMRR